MFKLIMGVLAYMLSAYLGPHLDNRTFVFVIGVIMLVHLTMFVLFDLPILLGRSEIIELYDEAESYSRESVVKAFNEDIEESEYKRKLNVEGIFIMHNETKDKYFVGVDHKMLEGAAWQLEGNGFYSVDDDVKSGDFWSIRFIPIEKTNHRQFKNLWYTGISAFKADKKEHGYN